MSTQAISALNDTIESKIDTDHGPRHAARNSRSEAHDVSSSLEDFDTGSEQAAALGLVHYAALQNVLSDMASDSLLVDFTDWSKSDLEETFTTKQLYELIRFTRNHQSWANDLRKTQRAHFLRTGFCGTKGEEQSDDAEDGVYHAFEDDYLRILPTESAMDCMEDDENYESRNWATDADCDADMGDVGPTESTGSDTSDSGSDGSDDDAAHATESTDTAEIGAMMQKLVDKRVDERIDNVDDGCDCDGHLSESDIRRIVRDEVKSLIGDLV